jgi:hypothetical protein
MEGRHQFKLSVGEREWLESLVQAKETKLETLTKAQVLLLSALDPAGSSRELKDISALTGLSIRTIISLKERVVEGGVAAVVLGEAWPRPICPIRGYSPVVVRSLAMSGSVKPQDAPRWLARLLDDQAVELIYAGLEDYLTVEGNKLATNRATYWKTPGRARAVFVAAMEDLLNLYARPYQENRPVVCLKQARHQLVEANGRTIKPGIGRPPFDSAEYVRLGEAYVFLAVEPLVGRRLARVSLTETPMDWARFLAELDALYPNADKICLILDGVNTLIRAFLYETFSRQEAGRLSQRLEIHLAPMGGDWLNQAGLEFSFLRSVDLNQSFATVEALTEALKAWERSLDEGKKIIDWRFKIEDARSQLKRLYPIQL